MDPQRLHEIDSALAAGVEYHETIGSTQDRGRELARGGAVHGTLVLAGEQTGGRGRMGRLWGSPRGGLWLSMVLRPRRLALITQSVSVGVARALWELGVEARIKWPNDLLVCGGKICGILAEAGEGWVVVGIGLNADVDPAILPEEATSLRAELGRSIDLVSLLQLVLDNVEETLGMPPSSLLDEWRSLNCTLGEKVRVRVRGGEVVGRAVEITSEGALVVETTDGRTLELFEGDVKHLRREEV